MAAKLLSATTISRRPGSQRAVSSSACRAQSVSFLCRCPRPVAYRSEGASTVRNGRAQTQSAPGNGSQQHDAKPAQATGFDEVATTGPHGITVDAARLDLGPPAPFDRVVDAHYHWPRWHEGRDQQEQEPMADGTGR